MIDRLDIHAFADHELAPERLAQLESEINASPEAQRELEAIRGLKSCLKSKAQTPECGTVWKGCAERLNELDRVKKAESFVGKYAWGLCALLFVVIIGGGVLNRLQGGNVGMGQVASDISSMVPMQGTSSQPEQLNSLIHNPAIVIDPNRVRIVQPIVDRLSGRVTGVQLRDSIGLANLIIIPDVGGVDGGQSIGDGMFAGQINGHNCVICPRSGSAVLLMGDRDTSQLHDFALSILR